MYWSVWTAAQPFISLNSDWNVWKYRILFNFYFILLLAKRYNPPPPCDEEGGKHIKSKTEKKQNMYEFYVSSHGLCFYFSQIFYFL